MAKQHFSNETKTIFLVGMPGSGKSFWAQKCGHAFGKTILDLDDIISVRAGKSIAALVKAQGEQAFRALERDTLRQIAAVFPRNAIVACGGGTPCFFDNMALMNRAGVTVYLEASEETLEMRLRNDTVARPLLRGDKLREQLENLLHERREFYERATHTLSVATLEITAFERIMSGSLL